VGELNIGNRLDRVSVFGRPDITKDKEVPLVARKPGSPLERVVELLQSSPSPGYIQENVAESETNRFGNQQKGRVSE